MCIRDRPFDWNNIEQSALNVNKITKEQLKTFMKPKQALAKLKSYLEKYVDPYNSSDKFQPGGYNNDFDIRFMANFFKKCEDKYFGSWIDFHKLDVQSIIQFLHLKGAIDLSNYRLETVAKHFGVTIDSHDALSDIKATREIAYKILPKINYDETKN